MDKVISIHEYSLKPTVNEEQFMQAVKNAETCDLFDLPGLIGYHFIKRIRGVKRGRFAALWVYESLPAWENLWGAIDQPCSKDEYPQNWQIWEDKYLKPILAEDPDKINFTSYLEIDT